ncbi:MAG TPA: hypothetical protein EYP86_02565 [Candidatus Altiarchaeales archaeon]|nr:hypothetical protein [Candidatus Altiarchaeales archaeon]
MYCSKLFTRLKVKYRGNLIIQEDISTVMKFKNLFLGILIGILIGIILGVEIVHLAESRVCPEKYCIDSDYIIPVSDRGYFPRVHEILQKADKSIHIIAFELKYYTKYPKSKENILIQDLIEAHKRGVDVKIIVDEYSDENNAYSYLKENGIEIKYDSQKVTTHAKLIIVDNRIVVLGSTNFSYYGLEKNNEVDVIIYAKHIADYFEAYFQNLWKSN